MFSFFLPPAGFIIHYPLMYVLPILPFLNHMSRKIHVLICCSRCIWVPAVFFLMQLAWKRARSDFNTKPESSECGSWSPQNDHLFTPTSFKDFSPEIICYQNEIFDTVCYPVRCTEGEWLVEMTQPTVIFVLKKFRRLSSVWPLKSWGALDQRSRLSRKPHEHW